MKTTEPPRQSQFLLLRFKAIATVMTIGIVKSAIASKETILI